MPEGEGAYLPCSFWYLDNLIMQGRKAEARRVFERLVAIDVGLLSEEYDPQTNEFQGNFPQVLSHLCLVNSALNLEHFGAAHARLPEKTTESERPLIPRNSLSLRATRFVMPGVQAI